MTTRFKPTPLLTHGEVAVLIRQAMREGNIAQAANLFLQTGDKASVAIFDNFSKAQQQYENKLIGLEEWGRTQTQICHSILVSACMLETEMPQILSSEIKAKIFLLLHNGKTEQALTLCEDFGNEYLLLQAELYAAKNQSGRGLIESEYYEATKSKVNDSLEAMIGQIAEPALPGGLLDKFWSLFK